MKKKNESIKKKGKLEKKKAEKISEIKKMLGILDQENNKVEKKDKNLEKNYNENGNLIQKKSEDNINFKESNREEDSLIKKQVEEEDKIKENKIQMSKTKKKTKKDNKLSDRNNKDMNEEDLEYYLEILDTIDMKSNLPNINNQLRFNDQININFNNKNINMKKGDKKTQISSNDKTPQIENLNMIDSNDILIGIADQNYFENKINNNQSSLYFDAKDFILKDVDKDGNCGYRSIANQIYSNEEYHYQVRRDVYEYINLNKNTFQHLNFEVNGVLLDINTYIEKIKEEGFWMGDLEISILPKLYDATLLLFELRTNNVILLLSQYGDIGDQSKIFLNLCYVTNNHYNVLYEPTRKNKFKKEIFEINPKKLSEIKIKNTKEVQDLNIEIQYANDNRSIKYNDIYKFLKSRNITGEGIYPNFINNIAYRNVKKNRKKDFKDACKNYFIDEKTDRLKIKFLDSGVKDKAYKEYFIAYQIEKNQIIKRLHEQTLHKGEIALYELIKQQNYWWTNIYKDVKNYINNCEICQQLHKNKGRKPEIKQIISKGPRERYVVDLVDITDNIDDNKREFRYIMNIIDHYSKLVGSYLVRKKTAKEILNHINNFISLYGEPGILQCDHGKEFDNNELKEYCKCKNIKLIYSGVRHPTTNGVVEAVHKDIVSSLTAEKLKNNKNYDLNFSISNAVRAHNHNIHSVTKYSPEYLFYNNTEELSKEIEEKMKKSQMHRAKEKNPINKNSKVLISSRYVRKGTNLNIKFGKTGKRLIPGIVVGEGSGNTYPISISLNYNDLIKDVVYNIDFRLVKEVNDNVYNSVLNNFDILNNALDSDSAENSEN